jgi:hypothetical protein
VQHHDAGHLVPRLSWLLSPDQKTIFWICDIAKAFLAPLTRPELADRVWLNPVNPPPAGISIHDCVEQGRVMLYQPALVVTHEDEMLGKALKRQFFRATFARKERRRGVAYICDEFQRFVTADPESGEQSFLDRCRAYRTICVLATQSVASIRYALMSEAGVMRESALDSAQTVMLNNIGNKFFFRNTDHGTHALLQGMIPHSPLFGPHVVAVRPLSTLKPGECYALLASGNWGLQQIRLKNGSRKPPAETFDSIYSTCSPGLSTF